MKKSIVLVIVFCFSFQSCFYSLFENLERTTPTRTDSVPMEERVEVVREVEYAVREAVEGVVQDTEGLRVDEVSAVEEAVYEMPPPEEKRAKEYTIEIGEVTPLENASVSRAVSEPVRYLGNDATLTLTSGNRISKIKIEKAKENAPIYSMGLQFIREPKFNEGLFYIEDEPSVLTYAATKYKYPVDIIYITEDFLVAKVVKNVSPKPTDDYDAQSSDVPCKYVLEMKAGAANYHKIKAGKTKIN